MNNEVCYAIAINAHKQTAHGTKIEIKAGGVWARSDEEASGEALALAKSEWPVEDGWHTHGGVWAKFPKEEYTSNLTANVWRELWYRVLADKLFPWEPDVDTTMYHCTFCGHSKPGHKPTCPYAQAQALASKEDTHE